MEPEQIQALVQSALPDAVVQLKDLTGTKDHWEAVIVSKEFAGKSLIQQHQLVYRALGDAMAGPIHALALKTFTPEAWEKTGES